MHYELVNTRIAAFNAGVHQFNFQQRIRCSGFVAKLERFKKKCSRNATKNRSF
jgi:hypothetical protein